jgi:hypothetical protein
MADRGNQSYMNVWYVHFSVSAAAADSVSNLPGNGKRIVGFSQSLACSSFFQKRDELYKMEAARGCAHTHENEQTQMG